MTKGSIVRGLTSLVRATTKLVSRIALQEKAVTADVLAPNSNEETFYFDAYSAAVDFSRREAVNRKSYASLERSGDGWAVRIETGCKMQIINDTSQNGLREISEKTVIRTASLVSQLKERVIGIDDDYSEHGCGTAYINQRPTRLAEQNKDSEIPVQLDEYDFHLDEELVLVHYKKYLEMSKRDLDALWEKRNTLELNEFEGLRLAARAKKGLTRLAETPTPAVCPTCFMVGNACTCQNRR